jgi:hypothetical protein
MLDLILLVSLQTQPATLPSTQPASPQAELERLLSGTGQKPPPLRPSRPPGARTDATGGGAAVSPGARPNDLLREGTLLVDKAGRLTKSADGQAWELTFESDGRSLSSPPMVLVPNLLLMSIEEQVKNTNRDVVLQVTGTVTEYRGRNYLILEKATMSAAGGF